MSYHWMSQTGDLDKNIYGRYRTSDGQQVAVINKIGDDYWVKQITMKPIPFSSLEDATVYITSWFMGAIPEEERSHNMIHSY